MTAVYPHRYEGMEEIAEAIDASRSWQFLAASRKEDEYWFTVVSKGAIPLLAASAFEGIEARITIDSEERETYSRMHVVHYVGDIVGLELFVDYIVGELDGKTEGNEDPIGDFRNRNPLWGLTVFGSKS